MPAKTNSYDQAIARVTRYIEMREALQLRGLDDVIHGIHTGTKWEAELRLSDLRSIVTDAADTALVVAELRKLRVEMREFVELYRNNTQSKRRRHL